jgi:hypothetical protein
MLFLIPRNGVHREFYLALMSMCKLLELAIGQAAAHRQQRHRRRQQREENRAADRRNAHAKPRASRRHHFVDHLIEAPIGYIWPIPLSGALSSSLHLTRGNESVLPGSFGALTLRAKREPRHSVGSSSGPHAR